MKIQLPLGWLAVVLGGLAATGCIASPDEEVSVMDDPALQTEALTQNALTQNALTQNALTQNALTQNALTQNALTQNALTQNALTQNALTQNALTQNALEDPNARELFSYIVSCALPDGASLQFTDTGGETHVFDGSLGLASEWGEEDGRCKAGCQQWVSGCVLSRLNYLGEHVSISVRGTNEALETTLAERDTYWHREATYYGNIFSTPQRFLACLSPWETGDKRVCGPSLEGCAVTFTGMCNQVCKREHPISRAFYLCDGPSDHAEASTQTYVGDVTVFLPQ